MSTLPSLSAQSLCLPDHLPADVRAAAYLLCSTSEQPVGQLTEGDLAQELPKYLGMLPLLLNHRNTWTDPHELAFMAQAAAEMIHQQFPLLTLTEVCLAFRQGASGKWKKEANEILHLSLPTLRSWLSSYQCVRAEALRALYIVQQQQAEEERRQQQAAAYRQQRPAMLADFATELTTTGAVRWNTGLINGFYEWLKRMKVLRGFVPSQPYEVIKQQERERLQREGAAASRPRGQSSSVADVLRQAPSMSSFLDNPLRLRCRERVLLDWLASHTANETDLLAWAAILNDDQ